MAEMSILNKYPKRVILTDDTLRAKMLAAHHLEHAVAVCERDNVLVYNGSYKNTAIALIATNINSDAISNYLPDESGKAEVVYIGTCVSAVRRYALRSVVLAESGDNSLLERACLAASKLGIPVIRHPVGTGYLEDPHTAAFFTYAKEHGVAALSVLTVSENIETGEQMEEHERRSRLYNAARLTLELLALDIK